MAKVKEENNKSNGSIIAIDLDKCYGCKKCMDIEPGLYNIVEKGIRAAVCRHCENPPCVASCPVEALEKLESGDIKRFNMKCVACRQCANACPVGANPQEILNYRTFTDYKINISRCRKICFEGAVSEVEQAPEGWLVVDGKYAVKALDWK